MLQHFYHESVFIRWTAKQYSWCANSVCFKLSENLTIPFYSNELGSTWESDMFHVVSHTNLTDGCATNALSNISVL